METTTDLRKDVFVKGVDDVSNDDMKKTEARHSMTDYGRQMHPNFHHENASRQYWSW